MRKMLLQPNAHGFVIIDQNTALAARLPPETFAADTPLFVFDDGSDAAQLTQALTRGRYCGRRGLQLARGRGTARPGLMLVAIDSFTPARCWVGTSRQ